jgi:hypothetical protein
MVTGYAVGKISLRRFASRGTTIGYLDQKDGGSEYDGDVAKW